MTPDRRTEIPVASPPVPGRLRITDGHWKQLREHLLSDRSEHAALLVCGISRRPNRIEFLVRSVIELTDEDYLDAGPWHLSIAPRALARHIKRAREDQATLVLCHSHPFPGRVLASPIDLATEIDLCGRVFSNRLAASPSAALILGPDGLDGRVWSSGLASPLEEVTVVGSRIERLQTNSCGIPTTAPDGDPNEVIIARAATSRQALLWGEVGERSLRRAHIAVIGCGGTGSHVITQLVHLRVGAMTLIDHDVVETTNLSRLVGAAPDDVTRRKVDVLAEHARRINPSIRIDAIGASVIDVDPHVLLEADVIVCATDGHGSRALLTELAQQYLIPVVDLGVEVDPNAEAFRAGGGVRVLRPGRGCLHCAQTLSPAMVREEYLDEDQRRAETERGYIRGEAVPAPSVIALNGVVASLAVLEVCQLLVGMLGDGRDRLLYRAESRALSTASMPSDPDCYICGRDGMLAMADARPLPTRWRATANAV
jgi:molybdopterin/thiamine biosynthesis adenylyltransferase